MPPWETGGFFMRFTIRELILVTLVVALAAGWTADRWRMHRTLAEKLNEYSHLLDKHGFEIVQESDRSSYVRPTRQH